MTLLARLIGSAVFGIIPTVGFFYKASAQDALPRYDVTEYCRAQGELHGRAQRNRCMEEEQRSYDYLNQVWHNISAGNRAKCINEAKFYGHLEHCVISWERIDRQMRELKRLKRDEPKPFRY
jgi:hypothetical protein